MNIFLHIGLPKTATTHLQYGFGRSRKALEKKGVFFPCSGLHRESFKGKESIVVHHELAWALRRDRTGFSEEDSRLLDDVWPALREELANSTFPNAIITSEAFGWEWVDREPIETARSFLDGHTVKIVVVTRDTVPYVESLYLQAVKDWGYIGSATDFLGDFYDHINFRQKLAYWRSSFGDESIIHLKYEDIPRESYFLTVMGAMGIKGIKEPHSPTLAQNPSLPQDFVSVFRTLSSYNLQGINRLLLQELRALELPKARVYSDAERTLISRTFDT